MAQPWKFHSLAVAVSSKDQVSRLLGMWLARMRLSALRDAPRSAGSPALGAALGDASRLSGRTRRLCRRCGFEDAEGFAVGADGYEQRHAVDAVDDRRLLHERVPGIGAAGAIEFESDHDVARFELSAGKADHDGKLGDFRFPVAVVFLRIFRDGSQHLAVRRLPISTRRR